MSEQPDPDSEKVDKDEAAEPDVESDPQRGEPDQTSTVDWADEGGALPEGPATDPEDA